MHFDWGALSKMCSLEGKGGGVSALASPASCLLSNPHRHQAMNSATDPPPLIVTPAWHNGHRREKCECDAALTLITWLAGAEQVAMPRSVHVTG